MRMIMLALSVIVAGIASSAFFAPDHSQSAINIHNGVAAHGYDVVAYFTQSQPIKGKKQFTTKYQGAAYRFASQEHLQKFTTNPAQFAPQYGGYCAYGVAIKRKVDGKPDLWDIIDGKLYLNYNQSIKNRWNKNTSNFIHSADLNWPLIKNSVDN